MKAELTDISPVKKRFEIEIPDDVVSGEVTTIAREFAKRAREITEQHGGTGSQRVWLSTLAGPNTGSVIVAVEYPSMVSMAQSQAKVNPTPEWQKFIDDFQKSGMRVLSSSLSFEITP